MQTVLYLKNHCMRMFMPIHISVNVKEKSLEGYKIIKVVIFGGNIRENPLCI